MKAKLIFLKDFYSPLHKKFFISSDPKRNSIEIEVDINGNPVDSFWHLQLKDSPEYFELITTDKPKKK